MPNPTIHVASLAPYQLADLQLAPGVEPIMLAQNESLRAPSPKVAEAIVNAATCGRLYPDPNCDELDEVLRQAYALPDQDRILVGAGSMELIGVLIRAYAGPGDEVLTSEFAYGYFSVATAIAGADYVQAQEQNYTPDVDSLLAKVTAKTKLVIAVNPGNPTGTAIPNSEIRRLRLAWPADVLVVVDEAYGEFSDVWQEPVFDLVAGGDCVVLRTLSKAYGMAAMRVGWGYFPQAVAENMDKLLNPSRISIVSQQAAIAAVLDQDYMHETVRLTLEIADEFKQAMLNVGLSVAQSHTNFVLLKLTNSAQAEALEVALRSQGYLVRPMRGSLSDCLRITIGEKGVMQQLAQLITDFVNHSGQ